MSAGSSSSSTHGAEHERAGGNQVGALAAHAGHREPLGLASSARGVRASSRSSSARDHGAVDLGEVAARVGCEQARERAHRAARRDRGSRRPAHERVAVLGELLAHARAHGALLVARHRVRAHQLGVQARGAERQRRLEAHVALVAGDQLEAAAAEIEAEREARADLQLAAERREGEARLFGAREDAASGRRPPRRSVAATIRRRCPRRAAPRSRRGSAGRRGALRALSPSSRAVSTARSQTSSGTWPPSATVAPSRSITRSRSTRRTSPSARGVGDQQMERRAAEIEDAEADRRLLGVAVGSKRSDSAPRSAASTVARRGPRGSSTEPFSQRGSSSIASPSARSRSSTAPIASPWVQSAVARSRNEAIALEELRLVAAFGESLVDLDREAGGVRERRERLAAAQRGARHDPLDAARRERCGERARLRATRVARAAAAAADPLHCVRFAARACRTRWSFMRRDRSEEGSAGARSRTRGGRSASIDERDGTSQGCSPCRASRKGSIPTMFRVMNVAMSWKPEVDEIERRRATARSSRAARTRSRSSTRADARRCASASPRSSTPIRSTNTATSRASPRPTRAAARRVHAGQRGGRHRVASTGVSSSSAATTSRSAAARIRPPACARASTPTSSRCGAACRSCGCSKAAARRSPAPTACAVARATTGPRRRR